MIAASYPGDRGRYPHRQTQVISQGIGVTTAAFSPDDKTLATSGTNGSAYLWRIH